MFKHALAIDVHNVSVTVKNKDKKLTLIDTLNRNFM